MLILLALRNPADLSDPIGPKWVEEIGRDFTALGGMALSTSASVNLPRRFKPSKTDCRRSPKDSNICQP
jgi:hypothetical protein